jgi:hypothetical protein
MICHGLNCTCETLIDAHIIPKSFGRFIRRPDANVKLTPDRVSQANPQLGEYDPDILCASCDGILGLDDEYAVDICRRFAAERLDLGSDLFELAGADGFRFGKFILSVLWRASISRRPSFASIDLGPDQDKARDVLFGAKPLSDLRAFELLVQRYRSDGIDATKLNFHPEHAPFGGLNAYGFGLAGFRIIAKLDDGPLPQGYAPFVMNRSGVFRGMFVRFEDCSEFASIASIVRNNERRPKPFRIKAAR